MGVELEILDISENGDIIFYRQYGIEFAYYVKQGQDWWMGTGPIVEAAKKKFPGGIKS